jgi:hypothetical protein
MVKKKVNEAPVEQQPPPMVIQNCHFVGQESANEHTREAVVALANAAKANAEAISAIACSLQGPANNSTCIRIEGGRNAT